VTNLTVFLAGERAGNLTQSSSGDITFRYDNDYRDNDDSTPLSLSMPLAATLHKKRAVFPFLQGLLPDSQTALQALGSRYEVPWRNPFALLRHIGADVAGALEILPEGQEPPTSSESTAPQALSDSEIRDILTAVVNEYETGQSSGRYRGYFSVAGAQPKLALHRRGGSWFLPDAANPSTHILKPAPRNLEHLDIAEQLTMMAARHCGLSTAESSVEEIEGISCFVTTRYDRSVEGGQIRRIHQEDFAQALSVSPERKYQHRDGGPGVARIAQLCRSFPIPDDRHQVGKAFYRAFAFNVIAGCTDAHAKNYSLLLQGNRVTLAPLYDLVTFGGYWVGDAPLFSAMSVDGAYSLDHISASALARVGALFGVEKEATEIVHGLQDSVVGAFESSVATLLNTRPDAEAFATGLLQSLRKLPLLS
jgi:serine/threonine-protein kinase HipA